MNPTRADVGHYLTRQIGTFDKEGRRSAGKASMADVHRLRIATRRARAGLESVSEIQLPRALSLELRRLGKRLGRLREIDVAITDSRRYGLGAKKLKRRRKKLARETMSGMRKSSVWIGRSLKASVAKLEHGKKQRPDFSRLCAKLRKWRDRPVKTASDAHKLRIVVKKARYALELARENAAPLEELQKVLGKDHDLEVLQKLRGKKRVLREAQKKYRRKALHIAPGALKHALSRLEGE